MLCRTSRIYHLKHSRCTRINEIMTLKVFKSLILILNTIECNAHL